MSWIVLGEQRGNIVLVSRTKEETEGGILHKGSYITIEDQDRRFILRVEDSYQHNPYSPSPMIVDMDLSPLLQDQKCQNIVYATRIVEHPDRTDGHSSFIRPQLEARISNQDDIDLAFQSKEGIPVFPATAYARNCQKLRDKSGRLVNVAIPEEVFFHQMLIAGSTGSGKTVAMKYLAQYFVEELNLDGHGPGAVLAVNVKEEDMLTMNNPSSTNSTEVGKEWTDLGLQPHGIDTFRVYYPGNQMARYSKAVDPRKCERITLQTIHIDPEVLTGLIQNMSDLAADQLPAIFRFWKEKIMKHTDNLSSFIRYFEDPNKDRQYQTLNTQGDELSVRLHAGTYQSIVNSLTYATEYFDVHGATELTAKDILQPGKMSVIDVTARHGLGFGSVLLRDLLDKIYDAKSRKESQIPILIIIDEVHEFYSSERSREALQTLDAVCRKGRSLEIGVIFSSQNPSDMPRGVNNVVNTRVFFKSDAGSISIKLTGFEPDAMKPGYAVASVHGLSQLRFMKFPLSLAGVSDGKKRNE